MGCNQLFSDAPNPNKRISSWNWTEPNLHGSTIERHYQELWAAEAMGAGSWIAGGAWTKRPGPPATFIVWRVHRPLLCPGMVLHGLRPDGGTGARCKTWIGNTKAISCFAFIHLSPLITLAASIGLGNRMVNNSTKNTKLTLLDIPIS